MTATSPAADAPQFPVHFIDDCVALAADRRPWAQRNDWHGLAACRHLPEPVFTRDDPPSAGNLRRCARCPVRTECAVEGLRQNRYGLVVDSPDELYGHFGGLSPDERAELLADVRGRARARGIALADTTNCRTELILRHFTTHGWTPNRVAGELGIGRPEVIDHLILAGAQAGLSHRETADVIGDISYKTVERRLRDLRRLASHNDTEEVA